MKGQTHDAVGILHVALPEQSDYTCYMFGGDATESCIVWTPSVNAAPNWWVRFWMTVFLGCTWVKR